MKIKNNNEKINYKFLSSLHDFLKSENFQDLLQTRLSQIDKQLLTPADTMAKVTISKWKEERTHEQEQKLYEFHRNKYKALQLERIEVKDCIESGSYKIGLSPFEDIENARFLLANIHVLEEGLLKYQKFNPQALNAVKAMLKENFNILFNAENKNKITSCIPVINFTIKDQLVDIIINKHNPFIDNENSDNDLEFLKSKIESLSKLVDYNIAPLVLEKLEWIAYFYSKSKDNNGLTLGNKIWNGVVPLLLYFDSEAGINSFLSSIHNTSEYSELILRRDIISDTDFTLLPYNIVEIWKKFNDKFGKEGLEFLQFANEIHKKVDLAEEFHSPRIAQDFNKLYNFIKNFVNKINYDSLPEHKELLENSKKYGYNEIVFKRIVNEILPKAKKADHLPNINFSLDHGKHSYIFSKVKPGDISTLFLGKMVPCCQFIGSKYLESSTEGYVEQNVINAFIREDSCAYVLHNEVGRLKGFSYAYIGKNENGEKILVLDYFEHFAEVKDLMLPLVKRMLISLEGSDFQGLHIGEDGDFTGSLCHPERINISPWNNDLPLEGYCNKPYKVTKEIEVTHIYSQNYQDYSNNISNFADLVYFNAIIKSNIINLKYKDFIKNFTQTEISTLDQYSVIIYSIVKNKILGFNQTAGLILKLHEKLQGTYCNILKNEEIYSFSRFSVDVKLKLVKALLNKNGENIDRTSEDIKNFKSCYYPIIRDLDHNKITVYYSKIILLPDEPNLYIIPLITEENIEEFVGMHLTGVVNENSSFT